MAASNPILLAVETTSVTGSLSIARLEGKSTSILATHRWQKKSSHSEVITLELLEALKTSELQLQDLTHLVVDVGPGSFTGIRVGLNLIRSLAYSLELPTLTFTALEVLAFQALSPGERGIIAIPAVQNYFYAGAYERKSDHVEILTPAESLDPAGIEKLKESTKIEKLIFPNEEPKSESLVQLTMHDFKNSKFLSWKEVLPLYIRRSEAEEKMRKGLLKPIA